MTPGFPGNLTNLTDVALTRVGGCGQRGTSYLNRRTAPVEGALELSLEKSQAMRLVGGSFRGDTWGP